MSYDGLFPIAFMDAPQVLNASVTPIPAASGNPLQVIANIGLKASYAIDYIDSTGDYIGVYVGAAGHEKMITIIGGGAITRAYVVIAANSRVSLRSTTNSSITNGYLTCVFMGMGWNGSAS